MSNANSKQPRMAFLCPPALRARIVRLQVLTEAESQAEVIRCALRAYEALVLARDAGDKILLQPAEGPARELVLT